MQLPDQLPAQQTADVDASAALLPAQQPNQWPAQQTADVDAAGAMPLGQMKDQLAADVDDFGSLVSVKGNMQDGGSGANQEGDARRGVFDKGRKKSAECLIVATLAQSRIIILTVCCHKAVYSWDVAHIF